MCIFEVMQAVAVAEKRIMLELRDLHYATYTAGARARSGTRQDSLICTQTSGHLYFLSSLIITRTEYANVFNIPHTWLLFPCHALFVTVMNC